MYMRSDPPHPPYTTMQRHYRHHHWLPRSSLGVICYLQGVCRLSAKANQQKTDYFLKTFSGVVGLFEYVNACVISFRYSWATMKNNLSYIFLQKGEISGLAQISTISADWIFGVSIFGLNHFKTILNQFYKLLCLSCCLNFLKHPQLFGCKSSLLSPNVL